MKVIMMIRSGPRLCCSLVYWRHRSVALWSFSCLCFSGSLAADTMQSTTNYLWLISDLLGQGATANVYRGRHKVGTNRTDHWRSLSGSLTGHWAGHWAGRWQVTDGSEWRRSLILSGSLNNTSRLESNQEPQDRPVIRVKTNECKNTELWIWCH